MMKNPLSLHLLHSVDTLIEQSCSEQMRSLNEKDINIIDAKEEHTDWIYENLTPSICEDLARRPCKNRDDAFSYLHSSHVTKLIRHEERGIVGVCGYQQQIGGDVEIFYWLSEKQRGRGYAYLGVKQLLEEFRGRNLAVIAEVFDSNESSKNVLKHLSFEFTHYGLVKNRKTLIYRRVVC